MKRTSVISGLTLLAASTAWAQTLDLSWHTIDGGGVMNSSAGQPSGFELSGTIGQPDAPSLPVMTGGSFELVGGFWAAVASPPIPSDCDQDGDVDLDDYTAYEACLTGPGAAAGAECECFDLDFDADVDLADFAEFQGLFRML